LKWLIGLRHAEFEEDRGFEALDTGPVPPQLDTQDRRLQVDGNGIRFGVGTVFGFSKHFALEAGVAFSFLQASVDAHARQEKNDGVNDFVDNVEGSNDNVRGEIRDFDARVVWTYGRLKYSLGYGGSTWDGLVNDPIGGVED